MKKSKLFSKLFLPSIVGIITLFLYLAYHSAESIMEKIIIGFGFITCLIPCAINCFLFMLNQGVNNTKRANISKERKGNIEYLPNNTVISKNINFPSVNNRNTMIPASKKEIDDPEYKTLKAMIISSSQNKLFSREDVLKLKCEIDYRLGTHRYEYDDFVFKNDFHEIYSKLKSSRLNTEDYQYLANFISEMISMQ